MGCVPPPPYDPSPEGRKEFYAWVRRQERMNTFRLACLAFGSVVLLWLVTQVIL